MGWKDLSIVKKGGIVGGLFGLIIGAAFLLFPVFFSCAPIAGRDCSFFGAFSFIVIFYTLGHFSRFLEGIFGVNSIFYSIFSNAVFLLFCFIFICSLLGFFIGWIRYKLKLSSPNLQV